MRMGGRGKKSVSQEERRDGFIFPLLPGHVTLVDNERRKKKKKKKTLISRVVPYPERRSMTLLSSSSFRLPTETESERRKG